MISLVIQITIALMLICVVVYIVKLGKITILEKRIGRYSIDSIKYETVSLFDTFYIDYKYLINKLSKTLTSIKIFDPYSMKYSKYIDYFNKAKPMDYIARKIIIGTLFMFIFIIWNVAIYQTVSIINILLVFLLGFFLMDIYYLIFDYNRKKNIEKELLSAIIIMNNAFKAGRSTMQAIEIVTHNLDGPIKKEFLKMYKEISLGLALDVVFKRFSDRIDLEEVQYITSSLTILNKTGGNIVKVFSNIEKSLFNKQKLKLEMKSLTESTRIMTRILIFLPFVFCSIIYLLSPTYFDPLLSPIGLIVIIFILLLYTVYVIFVTKIMKVKV